MRKIIKLVLWVLACLIVLAGLGLGYLTVTEYRPAASEAVALSGGAALSPKPGGRLSAVSFNIGYCGLPAEADFFLDGGTMARVGSKDIVERDLEGVTEALKAEACDLVLLQEVDRDSKRSYGVDEAAALQKALGGQSAFAANFLCPFVPIPPLDPIGKVSSGVMTLLGVGAESATRVSLPSPFAWPLSTCNLKRCLLVTRIPVEGSEKQLVVVNLHLEAYDDGAGKAAQTKVLVDFLTQEYEKGNYVVAGGDFNQTLPGVDAAKYPVRKAGDYMPGTLEASILPEGWTFAVDNAAPTCRLNDRPYDASAPDNRYYMIDGFILSPNVSLDSVRTLPLDFRFSDHNPVRIEFTIQ
jgi:endonuclease/exonuclease/phosphatase family metal-dependent hydrolase